MKTLSMMSGKGGSGKTTLALSIAQTLSRSGLQVLVVDCDLATHGLTYFFEARLTEGCCSVYDMLGGGPDGGKEPFLTLDEDPGIAVIPSITALSGTPSVEGDGAEAIVRKVLAVASERFDLVIFDAQAGYSPMCQALANMCDLKLFVYELDAVSTSANRVLYHTLAMDPGFSESGFYQVINKLSAEDREVYAKVSGGTLLQNLSPVSHSWAVRRAFGECRLPSVGRDLAFSSELHDLLYGLMPFFRPQLDLFSRDYMREAIDALGLRLQEVDGRAGRRERGGRLLYAASIASVTLVAVAGLAFLASGLSGVGGPSSLAEDPLLLASMVSVVAAALASLVASSVGSRRDSGYDAGLQAERRALVAQISATERDLAEVEARLNRSKVEAVTRGKLAGRDPRG